MEVVLANNATSTLQTGIEPEDTVIQVRAGDGAKFPVLSAGKFFPLTIVSTDGNSEIVYVVERNWDTFIVLRGQEGTSARSFPSGSVVELRLTKGVLDQFALLGKQASFSQISASDGAQLGGWRFTLAGDGSLEMRWGESIPYFIMTPEGLPLFWKMPMSSGRIFDAFPPGTRMVFQQETAPIDWVKITGIHDFALRLVEGNVGVGGAHPFSVVFGLRYIGHENLPNVPLYGGTNWAGDHAHEYGYYRGPSGSGGNGGQVHASTLNTGWTSVAGGHGHDVTVWLGGQGLPLDFRPYYVDVILAQKQ